ncbi:high affinity cAMP-specific and IBMX-insensitive 3',5'-cyclic phosphodiesterase 8 isoform X4 [Nilaparvata lugens]|uniref:high affinity cAMP-specific and IBMX-insensitive 3',5'-cyclic phosphodiesterase 8 isoform X4 n=1 Tax=Nilaparvata lugens TaxID=108931 RepID=UPI00193E59FA|nr:high affinity cAMP-specific and IBMX-insensitive 3',5'-cyclic phosphodiesterase 8 isoform X4 [Nilaparvata lugens]
MGCAPSTHKKRRPRDDHLIDASGGNDRDRSCRVKRDSEAIIYSPTVRDEQEGGNSATCGSVWDWCWGHATCCKHSRSHRYPLVRTNLKAQEQTTDSASDGEQLRPRTSLVPQPVKVLLVFYKDDSTCRALASAADRLGYGREVITSHELAVDVYQAHAFLPHVIIVDMRYPNFHGEQLCRALKSDKKKSPDVLLVAIMNKKAVKSEKDLKSVLNYGFDRVLVEPFTKLQSVSQLLQLCSDEIDRLALHSQNTLLTLSLERSRDLILITDQHHTIQYVNKTWCSVIGYRAEDVISRPVQSFHHLGNMETVLRQVERGNEWDGKVGWKSRHGESILLQCHASPFSLMGKEPTNFLYVQENPQDSHGFPRGSINSLRKGSYDLKSITSDARRQSLAKLHNLPIEAPITKVITLICAAQESSTGPVIQLLDKVLEILRTTELYSTHLKNNDNLKCDDPVTSDLIGALITQPGPLPMSSVRRSSDSSNLKHSILNQGGKSSTFFSMTQSIKDVLDSSLNWEFDIFKLEEVTGRRPLAYLGMNLLTHYNVNKTLGVDERTLFNWLSVIEQHYHIDNSYHNSTHAADVMQATSVFLDRERIKRSLDDLDEACCLIAAACHDIDHPGKSSAFLCNAGNDLAILYNDISVLESHHAALTFKLTLKDERVNIFRGLERDTYKVVRQNVVDMILATEMTKHFEHISKFVSVFNKPTMAIEEGSQSEIKSPSETGGDIILAINQEEVNLIKRMMIKCADVSNPTRPLQHCVEWARRIAEEYFTQTDEEKARHLPVVMPMFDRTTCSIPKSQMGFFDFIVNDMFEAWDVFVDMPELLENLRVNYRFWSEMGTKGINTLDQIVTQSNLFQKQYTEQYQDVNVDLPPQC